MATMKEPTGKEREVPDNGVNALQALGWELVSTSTPEEPAEEPKDDEKDAEGDAPKKSTRRTAKKE